MHLGTPSSPFLVTAILVTVSSAEVTRCHRCYSLRPETAGMSWVGGRERKGRFLEVSVAKSLLASKAPAHHPENPAGDAYESGPASNGTNPPQTCSGLEPGRRRRDTSATLFQHPSWRKAGCRRSFTNPRARNSARPGATADRHCMTCPLIPRHPIEDHSPCPQNLHGRSFLKLFDFFA